MVNLMDLNHLLNTFRQCAHAVITFDLSAAKWSLEIAIAPLRNSYAESAREPHGV